MMTQNGGALCIWWHPFCKYMYDEKTCSRCIYQHGQGILFSISAIWLINSTPRAIDYFNSWWCVIEQLHATRHPLDYILVMHACPHLFQRSTLRKLPNSSYREFMIFQWGRGGGSTWVCSCLTLDASPVTPPPLWIWENLVDAQYGTSIYTVWNVSLYRGGGGGGIFLWIINGTLLFLRKKNLSFLRT